MNMRVTLGLGALLAMVSTAALAFQEQTAGGAAATPAAPAVEAPKSPDIKGVELAPAEIKPDRGVGTEVRIPGLGKLGVLPKMDFGLELLYGASEQKRPDLEPSDAGDNLTIRGSVKHRF